jgi:UDP-N-acetylglucosamine 2-epimerase (non-hydrolysing)
MSTLRIDLVAGARPNFVKIAPVYHKLTAGDSPFVPRIVHTGQHYDASLSDVFFTDLNLPVPHEHLGVGSADVAEQTAKIMAAYDILLATGAPDVVLVVGDVNSTLGCALAASQRKVPVVHLEAGLRSFDRTMPEETNRVLTDRISDLLLTPSPDADANLRREGIPAERIRLVGNIMIDALELHRDDAEKSSVLTNLGLEVQKYALVTLHRPTNVDDHEVLAELLTTFATLSEQMPFVLPVHPRLRKEMDRLDARVLQQVEGTASLKLVDPFGYIDFQALETNARVVLTDSGGIQEESTVLGVPCLTLRDNTERPITVAQGTNRLVPSERQRITEAFEEAITLPMPQAQRPHLWDGRTADRVVQALSDFFRKAKNSQVKQVAADPVRSFCVPCATAHRSPVVRRELLLVAETGSWQETAGAERLADRIASYTKAEHVVLCADVPGGVATLRAHYHGGRVAVLGGGVPADVAAVLNGSTVNWPDCHQQLPANVELVYVPPVQFGSWQSPDVKGLVACAEKHPGIPFIVDERWFEFTGQTVANEIARVDNLIAIRSMGPAFGLNGLGVGYMLGSKRFVTPSVTRAAEVGVLPVARRAAMVALVDQGYLREYVETRLTTRTWLAAQIGKLGFETVELPGPHIFIRGTMPAQVGRHSCTVATEDGWLWAVGTPDQVEDQLSLLEETPAQTSS